ncbi:hypothetical protein COF68_05235 [Bacillus toyonensis]|uniref:hypothetical protein n=1 Tax=Bacillus toyonensis TaxID=155322 RepID=UPI000BFC3EF8|nr:hypothetical protein [Bacillus toyonensis]PHE64247.1 hypothetical protein COF68_05235 [Bacillus toyonensis]
MSKEESNNIVFNIEVENEDHSNIELIVMLGENSYKIGELRRDIVECQLVPKLTFYHEVALNTEMYVVGYQRYDDSCYLFLVELHSYMKPLEGEENINTKHFILDSDGLVDGNEKQAYFVEFDGGLEAFNKLSYNKIYKEKLNY